MPGGDVLDIETRRAIYQELQETPGAHFSDLQRRLEMATGTLQYHLRVLEERGLLEVRRGDRYTRYYPSFEVDRRDKQLLGLLRQSSTRRVLLDLLEHGESRLTDVSDRLDLAPSTVSFHLDKLREAEVVERPERGRYALVAKDPVVDLLVAYQASFADRAVDRVVSLFTGVQPDPRGERDEDEQAGDPQEA